MDKKYILMIGGGLLLIGLIVTLISVFSSKTPQTSELNFVTFGEDTEKLQKIVAPYEQANNIKINFIKKDLKNYELDSLNMISTNQIDVWGIPNNWLPKHSDKLSASNDNMVTNKIEVNALEAYKNLYPPSIVQDNVFDGKIYGYPLSVDALVMFSNRAIMSKAVNNENQKFSQKQTQLLMDVATNWTDLTAQANLLTQKADGKITQSGLAIGTSDLPASSDLLTLLMLQYGAQMTNSTHTEATFHTALNKFGGFSYPGAKALDFYTSFAKSNSPNYTFDSSLGDPVRAFAEGKIVYYIDYASASQDIQFINPKLSFTMNGIPQQVETKNPVNFLSYETFAVPKSSKNQDMAWGLLQYLTTANNSSIQRYYEDTGETSAPASYSYNRSKIMTDAIQTAVNWYNPEATETDKIFRQVIKDVLGGANSQTALEGAAVQITSLLARIKP